METKYLIYSQQPTELNREDILIDIVGRPGIGKTVIGQAIAEVLVAAGIAKEVSLHTDTAPSELLERVEKRTEIFNTIAELKPIGAIRIGESGAPRDGLQVRRRMWDDMIPSSLPSHLEENKKTPPYAKKAMDFAYHLSESQRLGFELGIQTDGKNAELERLGISLEEMQDYLEKGTWAEFYEGIRSETPLVHSLRRQRLFMDRVKTDLKDKLTPDQAFTFVKELFESMAENRGMTVQVKAK